MTANQIIVTALFCFVLPTFLVLGGWTGAIAGARADARMERRYLKAMERNASGDDKWDARIDAEVER